MARRTRPELMRGSGAGAPPEPRVEPCLPQQSKPPASGSIRMKLVNTLGILVIHHDRHPRTGSFGAPGADFRLGEDGLLVCRAPALVDKRQDCRGQHVRRVSDLAVPDFDGEAATDNPDAVPG